VNTRVNRSRPSLGHALGRALVVSFALLVAPGLGAARADVAPTRELTLEQALAMARQGNRGLVAERARLVQAHVTVDKAWTVLFPTIAAQGKYTRNNVLFQFPSTPVPSMPTLTIQPLDQLDGALSVSLPLVVPAAYPGLRAVNMTERAVQENVQATENSVLFGVAQTFYAAAIADEVLVARQSSIEVSRATLENAKTRFESGSVTKVDVDRAQMALLRAEQSEREAKLAREQTYRALGTLIRMEEPFRVVSRPAPVVTDGPTPTLTGATGDLASVLHLRPEFRALEASVQAEEAERRSHAWRWAPSLSGFGTARMFNYDNFARKSYAWAFGAQLDWVLYDGGVRDTQRRLAAAQAVETAARADVLRDSIRDDLANGRRQLETKGQAQQTFERAVELARETVELIRIQYEAGHSTQLDLLQAQDNLVAAQEALAQAHFDVAVADLTLRRATGTFP
jgi:outer membrane protein, multidrug efflux system